MEIHEVTDSVIEFLSHQIQSGFEGHPSKLYGWSGERSEGMHLSDILQDLYIRLEKPKHREGESSEALWSAGLAWEEIMSWAWSQVFPDQPDRIIHLGEFEKDGIILTPDRVDTMWPGLVEMKATWKWVSKWPISECWYWLKQAECYCYALGFDQCRFFVLYLSDVIRGIPPKCWEVKFTAGEMQRTWDMVLQHRDNLLRKGESK